MDIEKLIEDLRGLLKQYGEKIPYGELVGAPWPYSRAGDLVWQDPEPYFIEQAATALSTLQAESEKLRAEVESLKKEHCAGCSVPVVEAERLRDLNEAPNLRAELEQVKAERDAAVSWAQKYTESIDMPCVACKHNTGDYVCTAICGNCGPMGAESCKWEFDFSGELKED